jgi:hypothetical protein
MSSEPNRGSLGTLPYTHIPQEQWSAFFDDFSRDKLDVPFNVDVETPDAGRHELAHEAPLVGITASAEHGPECTIELILGGSPQGHQSHTFHKPERVTVIPAADGHSFCLEIECEAGEVATLRWCEPGAEG